MDIIFSWLKKYQNLYNISFYTYLINILNFISFSQVSLYSLFKKLLFVLNYIFAFTRNISITRFNLSDFVQLIWRYFPFLYFSFNLILGKNLWIWIFEILLYFYLKVLITYALDNHRLFPSWFIILVEFLLGIFAFGKNILFILHFRMHFR